MKHSKRKTSSRNKIRWHEVKHLFLIYIKHKVLMKNLFYITKINTILIEYLQRKILMILFAAILDIFGYFFILFGDGKTFLLFFASWARKCSLRKFSLNQFSLTQVKYLSRVINEKLKSFEILSRRLIHSSSMQSALLIDGYRRYWTEIIQVCRRKLLTCITFNAKRNPSSRLFNSVIKHSWIEMQASKVFDLKIIVKKMFYVSCQSITNLPKQNTSSAVYIKDLSDASGLFVLTTWITSKSTISWRTTIITTTTIHETTYRRMFW